MHVEYFMTLSSYSNFLFDGNADIHVYLRIETEEEREREGEREQAHMGYISQ